MIDLITQIAKNLQLDPKLVQAIISVESSGVTWTTRYEDGFGYIRKDYQEFASRLGITFMTEFVHEKTSWGLMQIMGATARDLGYKKHLPELCTPQEGIYWGCKMLAKQVARYHNSPTQMRDAISAYNGGTAIKDRFGQYANQAYVNKVIIARDKLG